jgi:hypothetical protein
MGYAEGMKRFQFEWPERDGPAVTRPERKGNGLAYGGTAARQRKVCPGISRLRWPWSSLLRRIPLHRHPKNADNDEERHDHPTTQGRAEALADYHRRARQSGGATNNKSNPKRP